MVGHPQLLALFGWYYYLSGRAGDFVATLDKLYASLPDIQNRRRDFWEGCVMLATLDPRYRIEEKVSQLQAQAGRPKAALRSVQSASLSQNLPFMHRSNRDYSPYAPDVEAGLAAFVRTFAGLLKDDFQPIEAMIRAGLYYEQNRLREALPLAEAAAAALAGRGAPELCFSAEMIRAAILSALRREPEARESLAALRSALSRAPYLLPNLAAYESRLLLADGDQAAARRWLDNYFVNEAPEAARPLELHKIYQHFTTARAWLVLGESEKAGALLAGLKQLGRDFARPLDLAEAEVLTAVSQWHLGQKGPATESLAGALEAVKGCGYIRVFADEGAAIEPVLKQLAAGLKKSPGRHGIEQPYLNRVMIAAKEQAARHRGLTAVWSPLKVKLSKQQRRIISLLAQGHRNAEIAELCGLSIHTVKSHCAAAYARLGVNNAADAVIKAGELELMGDI
ncbi:LuxR C-terminal-related transcriptional regulator [Deltaproteobacteria bacterium OttesenSCG-928-K17]|nr:LuxR C-terminal-related transcriptional regulator [Deltaproteobacteria bacterium OttesenSCG-928-K17]